MLIAAEARPLDMPSRPKKSSSAWPDLLNVANRLQFEPHRIAGRLDAKGRHREDLPKDFPFLINLFHLSSKNHTSALTWHERLELLMPLDGPIHEQVGERRIRVKAGELLVVDNLKLHQAVNFKGFCTRAVVITFYPEFVQSLGMLSLDQTFLTAFLQGDHDGSVHLTVSQNERLGIHDALTHLLKAYFLQPKEALRRSGTKAWFLVLLHLLASHIGVRGTDTMALRRQEQATRLRPLFASTRHPEGELPSLAEAATLCGMSKSQFSRVFREAVGMNLSSYLNQVRLSRATLLLETTTLSISEIALRAGFCDQSHFDRRFREAYGRTPSAHRNRHERLE